LSPTFTNPHTNLLNTHF